MAQSNQFTVPITILEPSKGWVSLKLRELWKYRELLVFLTWRDVAVRYKQAALGVVWAPCARPQGGGDSDSPKIGHGH